MRRRHLGILLLVWIGLLWALYLSKMWVALGVVMGLPAGFALAILLFAMEISANRATWGYGPSARSSSAPGSSS